MDRTKLFKDILLYFILPEDTTEAGGGVDPLVQSTLAGRRIWLGPVKTIMWTAAAVAAPLLLCGLLAGGA